MGKIKDNFVFRKLVFSICLVLIWSYFLLSYVYRSIVIPLPSEDGTMQLYTSDQLFDLKQLICFSMKGAKESLFLSSFGLSDDHISDIIEMKEKEGIHVKVKNDDGRRFKGCGISGLKHRKALIIDEEKVYLGSTNLTFSSLYNHRNMLVGFRNQELAKAILEESNYSTEHIQLYLLPRDGKKALEMILNEINAAKREIRIAMYTFTHSEITEALIQAKKRNVSVNVYLDRGSSRGASKKIAHQLQAANIPLFSFKIRGIFHHKCALIDDHFIFGSANWSKAAFTRNEEIIVLMKNLNEKEEKQIDKFFRTLNKYKYTLHK